jgi:hypothetical protein
MSSHKKGYLAFVKIFVPLCLTVYFVVGFSRIRTTDIVPFSAWALFIFVPNQPSIFTLQLDSLNGSALIPPERFEDGAFTNPHDITAYYLINRFGIAWEKGDTKDIRKLRSLLEKNILPAKPLDWELIKITYDPLQRWKTGNVSRQSVAHFSNTGSHD